LETDYILIHIITLILCLHMYIGPLKPSLP
jgi:hypothetical protein